MIPPHERRILEAHVRGCRLAQLDLIRLEHPLNEYEDRALKDLIKLRIRGVPLQYLTNSQAFYGRDFYVNTSVLVPRPETEGLVELVLSQLPAPHSDNQPMGLDFGTGSGAIALTLGLERADSFVYASEVSNEALAVAKENAKSHRVVNTEFLLVSEEPQLWQYESVPRLDFLVANPPYLVANDELAADVREHEPPEALFTPEHDPLYFYRFLAELAAEKLGPGGFGAFEIAEQRGHETALVFASKGFNVEVRKDLTERDRYLLVRRM
ncbi:MAG: peptide chain release factor N(5)-glutamine methyltransferase [Deltaproteobacteria bacterium]|nr:peptide chain release factor N(5)-glutamine methyltransferase [Deltaproteobacteria bacterium]